MYCNSITNITCVCGDDNLSFTAAVTICVTTGCNITDILKFERYAAESCGVANDKTKLHEVLLVDYTVPFITTLFVAGRAFARIKFDVGFGWDDWVMISAYASYMIAVGSSLGLALNKFGEHTFWLSTTQVITGLEVRFPTLQLRTRGWKAGLEFLVISKHFLMPFCRRGVSSGKKRGMGEGGIVHQAQAKFHNAYIDN